MSEKDIIPMREKEIRRYHIIQKVISKELTQREASGLLSLSERQIRRAVRRISEEGEWGVIHRSRGQPSNRQMSPAFKAKVIDLYRQNYPDFGPTLANEKLAERDGLCISTQTLRNWLVEAGLWEKRRKRKTYRQWRRRRECVGEMVQMDGSHHDWLEGRGPALVLMSYIDDATSWLFAHFYDYEGTLPAMESFKRYSKRNGLPASVYLDKHTTYKSPAKPTIEELLKGQKPKSQFERALGELGVEVIHAHSPQAKGRIERAFRTLQDRLIKEMRLKGVCTKVEANRFLGSYLGGFNRRFSVAAAKTGNLHRAVPAGVDLDAVLSIQTKRVLRKDWTVAYEGSLYQILDRVMPRQVLVEKRINGTLKIRCEGKYLRFRKIVKPLSSTRKKSPKKPRSNKTYVPPKDHPWRRPCITKNTGTNP